VGPLRIIILAALLYIGYRLIIANFRKSANDETDAPPASGGSITDVLVEDPVCHKLVPKEQAVKAEIGGETHYFCSRECCDEFSKESGED